MRPRFAVSSRPAKLNERSMSALVGGIVIKATTSSASALGICDHHCMGSSTSLAFVGSMATYATQLSRNLGPSLPPSMTL